MTNFVLSTRAREAIKVALAMVVVYAIAMQMGWDKPYSAAASPGRWGHWWGPWRGW